MDFSKKVLSPVSRLETVNCSVSDSARRNRGKMEPSPENDENRENVMPRARDLKKEPKNFNSAAKSPTSKKKILAENNESLAASLEMIPQSKHVMGPGHFEAPSQITPVSSKSHSTTDRNGFSSDAYCSPPYDPLTNYTSPRPEFLRYNPNRLREILQRIEKEKRCDEEGSWTGLSSPESSISSDASFQDKEIQESEADTSVGEDDEMEDTYSCRRVAWNLFFLFGFLLSSFCYISSMDSIPASPARDFGEEYRRANGAKTFPGSLMPVLIGISGVCLNATLRESTCGIGGFNNEVVFLHNPLEREEFEVKESQGVREVTTGDSSTVDEENDGILAIDNEQVEIVNTGTLTDTESVAEEKSREGRYQEIDALEESTLSVADPELLSESFRPAFTEVIFSNSSLEQDCRKDAESEGLGSVDVDESLDDQNTEEAKMSMNTLPGSIWTRHGVHLLTCLAMVIGLTALCKYFLRSCKISVPASPLSHSVSPAVVFEADAKISSVAFGKEQMSDIGFDASLKSSNNCVKEQVELNQIRPPTVELLGEFSVVETTVLKVNSNPKLQRREAYLSKEPQLSQMDNPVKKNLLSSSAYQNCTSPSESSLIAESITKNSSSVRKLRKKEEFGEQGGIAKVDVTPLRRSNRLRNRVTSP
ncbi:uncharacterized protein [Typha angustifolia]|uniref:uncharacterized protein n=1 Tax=Typha angustifolia TaxID=59011 RepID=UPI003C2D453C